MMSKFDEIRPYDDTDLSTVLKTLVNNQEFIKTLVGFRFAKWPAFTKPILGFFIKRFVIKKITTIHSLRDFQRLVEPYMRRMIRKTTSGLSVTGLETLDLSKPCLFVSNHRDIALDPAFINWVLHENGQDTVRIAVGDNLLSESWIADLIRLNKCFVVQRSIEGRREKLAAAKLLSEYIYHSLKTDKQHLWIAQKEGRAKDGIDLTNPAIISMLTLNRPKTTDFGEYVSELRIVPVSISYEFDPCDVNKAKELSQAEQEGGYDKPDKEDIRSIVKGITGQKGKVNVHFGKLIGKHTFNAKEVAGLINDEILAGYQTFPTSQIALDILSASSEYEDFQLADIEQEIGASQKFVFDYLNERLQLLSPDEQKKLLMMYVKPLLRQQEKLAAK
ncbi:MAG: 1-acyl-sn-glycerol-3-phosphate acyltransferase [Glaciecola sp.]|jgi:1-acyl-sn-glycerol-3-phosphate acyltransferase